MTAPQDLPDERASKGVHRTRHRGWASLLLGISVAACLLAAMVSVYFLALAALAALGAYAAWLGVSAREVVDLADDSTTPPIFPG